MGKSRDTGNLVSANNISVDIVNDRIGIGSAIPTSKLDVIGSSYVSGNLGIGSVIPTSKLDVSGQITLSTTPFVRNIPTISSNYTVTSTYNEMSIGPLTINSGVTVTVNSGATWTIV